MITIIIIISALFIFVISIYLLFFREDVQKKIEKAILLYESGNLTLAQRNFKEIISSHKDLPEPHWYTALINEKMGVYDAAEEECQKVLALKKFTGTIEEIEVRNLLAKLYCYSHKFDEAFKEYLHINKLYPDNIEILLQLGKVSLQKESFRDAIVYFEKYKKLNSSNSQVFYYLGVSYYSMNSMDTALDNFQRSVALDPKKPDTHFWLGEIYYSSQDYDKALKEYEQALSSEVLKQKCNIGMGKSYYNKNFYEQAVTCLMNAVQKPIEDSELKCELLYYLADSYSKTGNIEETVKYYKQVSSIDPDYRDVKKKINHYQTLTGDDMLHSFTKANAQEFVDKAVKIIEKMNFKVSEHQLGKDGVLDIIAQDNSTKVTDNYLIEFIRFESSIGELTLREMQSKMQDMQVNRGICLATASFTPEAIKYSSNRSIQLMDRTELINLLRRK
ncbi:MAG: tetratricopeptide repeat protein [Spirochaetes bacterium]|nr:tetratricopeptide repeat protein [Spirochaetota bacterium]